MRDHRRFDIYMPAVCTATGRGLARTPLACSTRSVSAGGLELLLPETLPVRTPVVIEIHKESTVRGHIVWVGQDTSTMLGSRFPHGVVFDRPVDATLVRQWVYQAKRQSHARASVRFDVEWRREGAAERGTCLNLGRGGMFVATDHPAEPGTKVMLHFTPPGLYNPLSLLARVEWMYGDKRATGAVTGMGVQFLDPKPSEAALMGAVVDRLRGDPFPSPGSPGSVHPSR